MLNQNGPGRVKFVLLLLRLNRLLFILFNTVTKVFYSVTLDRFVLLDLKVTVDFSEHC